MLVRLFTLGLEIAWSGLKAIPAYATDYLTLRKQLKEQPDFPVRGYFPALFDRDTESGHLVKHYFQQDLFVAQRIFQNKPIRPNS